MDPFNPFVAVPELKPKRVSWGHIAGWIACLILIAWITGA